MKTTPHSQNSDAGNENAESPAPKGRGEGTGVGRRMALGLIGLGMLALAPGRAAGQSGRGNQPFTNWPSDVDANGHDLTDLGGLEFDGEDVRVRGLLGENLTVDGDGVLTASDTRTTVSANGAEVASNATEIDFSKGFVVTSPDGEAVSVEAESPWSDVGDDGLLELPGFEGIEVGKVTSPPTETLELTSDSDLNISISGVDGAIRIETDTGQRIVPDDDAGTLNVADGTGNSLELDSQSGEVSIAAASKLRLDAPEIEIAADHNISLDSDGSMNLESSALMDLKGSLLLLNGGSKRAARVTDPVQITTTGGMGSQTGTGTIVDGSHSVLIGD